MKKHLQIFFFILCFATSNFASGQLVHVFEEAKQSELIHTGLSIMPTCEDSLTYEQVSSAEFQNKFEEVNKDTKYSKGCTHWMRLTVYIPDSIKNEEFFIIQKIYLDRTLFFFESDTGQPIIKKSGIGTPSSERNYNYPPYYGVRHQFSTADTQQVFIYFDKSLRISTHSPAILFQVFDIQDLEAQKIEFLWLFGSLVAIFILIVYNLSIYTFTKDKAYLYYSLAFLLLTPQLIASSGYSLSWFLNMGDVVRYTVRHISMPATYIYLAFSLQYLNEGISHKLRSKVVGLLKINFSVSALFLPFIIQGDWWRFELITLANLLILVSILAVMFLALRLSLSGSKNAQYYLYASFVLLPFVIVHMSQGMVRANGKFAGLIESTIFTRTSLATGIVLQALVFSIALAARINLMRKKIATQKEEKMIELQQLTERKNQELEQTVISRTQSLQEANEELKLSEESLHQINKTKDHFFAIISHELRGPVASFQGLSETLLYQIEKNNMKLVKDMVVHVDKSTNQLSTLLDNLLKWAQSQLGGMNYKPQAISLLEIAQDIQNMYETLAQSKGTKTVIDVEPPDLQAWADLPSAKTILRNIWGNALKFTENGSLSLSAREEANYIHITIADTGLGIDEERLATIFDIDQAKSTKGTQGERGNGLGLVLCQEFAKQNGGKITVESEEGKGTEVHVWLPISEKSPE